jgi:hypothetical protein
MIMNEWIDVINRFVISRHQHGWLALLLSVSIWAFRLSLVLRQILCKTLAIMYVIGTHIP